MNARALLSSSRLMMVPRRGKAVANWTRPSIDEMGVPSGSWKQVRITYKDKDDIVLQKFINMRYIRTYLYAIVLLSSSKLRTSF